MLNEILQYVYMTYGIGEYLRTPAHSNPEDVIRRQLQNRASIFLDTARRVIFANPQNPFFEMFRQAGCTLVDLYRAVALFGICLVFCSLN
jgi:hypothetical protein